MRWQDIILWVLFFLSIAVALWYLFGNSPTFEQTILVFILTILFAIGSKINNLHAEFKFFKKHFNNLEKSFIMLSKDFKDHLNDKNIHKK